MGKLGIFVLSALLITTSVSFTYPQEDSFQLPFEDGEECSSPYSINNLQASYDQFLQLLEDVGTGENRCSDEDIERINHFLALLAKMGLFPGDDEFELEKELEDLIAIGADNSYLFEPAILNGQNELLNFSGLQPFNGFNKVVRVFNVLPAYCANHGLTRSSSFQVGSFDLPHGAIGFINGINNQQAKVIESAEQLSEYAQGAKVYVIYNATNWDSIRSVSAGIDVLECWLGHGGIHTPPVQLLKNQWNHFIETHGPDAKFLQICHSGGADHVKNALLSSPESVRQKIITLAIAPSVIIPKKLCFQSYNYISKRDFVTLLDITGKLRNGSELQKLEPDPNANFWDHEFLSPTFKDPLERHITDYIGSYGGNK